MDYSDESGGALDVPKPFYEQKQYLPNFELLPTLEQYQTCYTVGFSQLHHPHRHGVGTYETAGKALRDVENLRRSDEEIRYICAPGGHRIEEWDLEERAGKEG